jgi:hypothetical protein
MDHEDVISVEEQSVDEDRVRELMQNYVDEETTAQLES